MKHISRPYQKLRSMGPITLAVAALCLIAPHTMRAQGRSISDFFANPFPSLTHASQGYLGVGIADVDQEKAQQLKLKDVRGAVIMLIDHDAPASKIGLKVNDVILSVNGQQVEGAEQLTRMLHEIPAGRKVSLEISRDGNIQTLAVELADRAVMERDVWGKMDKEDGDLIAPVSGTGFMGANGDVSAPPGFHMPFFGSSLNVGALVEPLTAQMAEALGVNGGLMVKTVARKTEAAKAGLRALDVILKVGSDPINTAADWERALRSNVGKQVQVTILRDKKQQTVSLQVDSKRHSELELFEIFGDANPELVAENDFVFPEALEAQAEQFSGDQFKVDPEDMQELQQQIEQFKKDFNADQFKQQFQMDQKQKDQLRQQMEQFKKSFNADQFKVDPKQMQEMQHQMDQWKQQMQDQMEYLREQQSGHFV